MPAPLRALTDHAPNLLFNQDMMALKKNETRFFSGSRIIFGRQTSACCDLESYDQQMFHQFLNS